MRCKMILAVVRGSRLEEVEVSLKAIGVRGITVDPVRGYGEKANYLRPDQSVPHVRITVFVQEELVVAAVNAIAAAGRTGLAGDGLVVVADLERAVRIRSGKEVTGDSL